MVLTDTSVWIDHLRINDPELFTLLDRRQIVIHPMVIGELACGNLPNRHRVLEQLKGLPHATVATDSEVLFFIENHRLMGTGISYIDAHLLTSSALHGETQLWTRDRRVMAVADELDIRYTPGE